MGPCTFLGTAVLVLLLLILLGPGATSAKTMSPGLQAALDTAGPRDTIPVIVVLKDRVALDAFRKRRSRRAGRRKLVRALRDNADRSQRALKRLLRGRGVGQIIDLWAINGVSIRARPRLIRELRGLPGISTIRLDTTVNTPGLTFDAASSPEWHLDAIRAPEVWSLGYQGAGVVVANLDSGVDLDHPDLAGRWRGGANSWFDPNGEHAAPFDANGHGTQTMGLMVGGDAGGTVIGVVPDATWIAAKIFNDAGEASLTDIHLAFQWLLDPDGNPATDDAPDVVNNSWNLSGTLNQCVSEFTPDIELLKAAGIAVAFSASNFGPSAFTSVSPANDSGFATGAVDSSLAIASFSSRGPSGCAGDIYPQIVAPGVSVRTADLTFGGVFPNSYASVTGTSFSAPLAAGSMALLRSAFPDAAVEELEQAVQQSALDLGSTGPDDTFGYGLLDVMAAYQLLDGAAPCVCDPTITITADTKVEVKHPHTNYSNDIELCADDDAEKHTLFKIDVAGALGAVTDATLHLTVRDAKSANSDSGGMIQRISDCSWDPQAIDYDQAESLGLLDGTPEQEQGPVDRGDPVSFDLSPWITGDGTYCFAVTSASSNGVDFYASESSVGAPRVTLTTDCSCSTTTTSTTSTTSTTTVIATTTTLPASTTTTIVTTTTVPTTTMAPTTTTVPTTTVEPTTTTSTTSGVSSCSPTAEVQDDARCRQGDPSENFDDDTLEADHRSGRIFYKYSILTIDVNDTLGAIMDLTLRLTVSSSSDHAGQIRLLTPPDCQAFIDNGGESEATYDNSVTLVENAGAPMSSNTAGSVSSGDTVEFDLKALGITSDGMYCVAITSPSSDAVKFHSKDVSTASNRPQLLVTADCDASPMSTTTTSTTATTSTSTTSTTSTATTSTTTTTSSGSCNPAAVIQHDVRCREGDANQNFDDDVLQVDDKPGTVFYKFSILEINVAGTQGAITDLRLRLTVADDAGAAAGQIRLLSPASCQTFVANGGESEATYNNSVNFVQNAGPAMSSNTAGSVSTGDTVEFDLRDLGISTDGMYCVALTGTSTDGVKYYSKDASTAVEKKPQLLMTTSCAR